MQVGSRVILVAAAIVAVLAVAASGPRRGAGADAPTVYRATLQPLNASLTNLQTTGEAIIEQVGGEVAITIRVQNAAPGIEHWQHIHGFVDNAPAACPTQAADTNGDGIIDIAETEPSAGITLIPFNADPVKLDITDNTYPRAGADGSYIYQKKVSVRSLQKAFAKKYNDSKLAPETRVIMIHGVPQSTDLPATVQSLGDIPARVTLPIACGKIERVPG